MKPAPSRFLPTTRDEMESLGWDRCDVILISGDAYVDHPSFGTAVIGRHLESQGWRVGVIAQPDWSGTEDFVRLGVPRLFVGVSSGAMDSMVNRYTSLMKPRSEDAYSEGGEAARRPDRAVLRYVNLVQQALPGVPVVIGGIEASLRRLSHFDVWSGKVRKSLLLDTKADLLVFGMGEKAAAEAASRLASGRTLEGIPGTAVAWSRKVFDERRPDGVELPSHEEVSGDPAAFMRMTNLVERENNPWCGALLTQGADTRVVVVQPPAEPLTPGEMDRLYALPFARRPHPSYRRSVPAFEMIRSSVTVVRGCAGGCSFCGLGLHQGRFLSSRSSSSVLSEIRALAEDPGFRGTVTDLGGPTANMYGLGGGDREACRSCRRSSCLHPEICPSFSTDHGRYIGLLRHSREVAGVKHVFVSSGIRFDLALRSVEFVRELAAHHVSGYLKIAPEHFSPEVLALMRKPGVELWREFLLLFRRFSKEADREQYVVPYLMAAFPGCTEEHMRQAADELRAEGIRPDKTQIFLPTPMTLAAAMYLTGRDTGGREIHVARKPSEKSRQLACLGGGGKLP